MNRRLLLGALLAAALGFVVHAVSIKNDFVYDDLTYIRKNPQVVGDAPVLTAPTPPQRPELGLWRPLTTLTYRIQFRVSGLAPSAFHAFNVAAHALVSALVVAASAALGAAPAQALAAGVLFAVHPIHSEGVAWVVGRAEILAALFALLALLVFGTPDDDHPLARALLAAACYAAGALSKETVLALPAFLVLCDLLHTGGARGRRRLVLRRALPLALAAVALVAVRCLVLGRFGPSVSGVPWLGELTAADRARLAVVVVGRALRFLLWPHPLSIHYEPRGLEGAGPLLLGLAAVTSLAWLYLRPGRRDPALRRATLLFLVSLLPFLHLVPIGAVWADRFLYLPSVGFSLAAACLLLPGGRPARAAVVVALAAITVAAALASFERDRVFRNDFTLWRDAERKDPTSALPAYQLGWFYYEAGILDYQSDSRRGAVYWWRESLRRDPRHLFAAQAHLRLGEFLAGRIGDAGGAADHYRRTLELDPRSVDARLDLAALSPSGVVSRAEAERLLREALVLAADEEQRRTARRLLDALLEEKR